MAHPGAKEAHPMELHPGIVEALHGDIMAHCVGVEDHRA
jgi:hypothetical protein